MKDKLAVACLLVCTMMAQAEVYNWPAGWEGDGIQPDGVWSYKGCSWDNNDPANFTAMSWSTADGYDHWYYGNDGWWYRIADGWMDNYANSYTILTWTAPTNGYASVDVSGSIGGWGACGVNFQILDNQGNLLVNQTYANGTTTFTSSISNLAVDAGDSIYIRTRTDQNGQYKSVSYSPLTVTFAPVVGVTVSYPQTVPHIHNNLVYPKDILGMEVTDGWWFGGYLNGNMLGADLVDAPGRTGEKALQFWFYANQSSSVIFQWVYTLDPQLSVWGAGELVFDIYAVDTLNCDVITRFGTQSGQAILPICWDSIGYHTIGQWDEVRIPIKTQRNIDNIRFDLDNQSAGVPNLQTVRFIIDNIRFEPTPDPVAEVPIREMSTTGAVTAGYLELPGISATAIKDFESLTLHLETAVASATNCVLKVTLTPPNQTPQVWSGTVALSAPYTVMDLTLGNLGGLCGFSDSMSLQVELFDGSQNRLAWLATPMTLGVYSTAEMDSQRQTLITRANGLQARADALKNAGVGVDAPQVSLGVADLFLNTYIFDDFSRQNQYAIAMQELTEVSSLLDKAEAEIIALEGASNPPGPVTAFNPVLAVSIQNGSFYQNGKPIVFVGPLDWNEGQDFIPKSQPLGFNSVVIETGLPQWYNGNTEGATKVSTYLSNAQNAGLGASLLLASHQVPTLTTADAPAISDYAGGGDMFPWNILKTETTNVFSNWYDDVLPVLANYSVVSVGTANEPSYQVDTGSVSFRDAFQTWATTAYADIDAANAKWGSSYTSFDTIDLPSFFNLRETSKAANYDWERFQSLKIGNFFNFLTTTITTSLSGKPVWIKLVESLGYPHLDEQQLLVNGGQNVHGTDGSSLLWLDYMKSLNSALPIVNPEWHIVPNVAYGNNSAFLDRAVFQGIAHGIGSGQIWQWCRYDWDSSTNGSESSITRYPLGLDSLGRASVKTRKLADVLSLFANLNGGSARMLFSKVANLHQGATYSDDLNVVYLQMAQSASGVRFLIPETLTSGNLTSSVKLLAAGKAGYIQTSALSVIEQWVYAGGTLWLTAPGLNKDPWNVNHTDISSTFLTLISQTGNTAYGSGRVVVDEDWAGYSAFLGGPLPMTGGVVNANIECRTAVGSNNRYLYLVNTSDEEQTFTLSPVPSSGIYSRDLWNNQSIDVTQSITLPGNGVALLIGKGVSFTDGFESGNFTVGGWTNSGCTMQSTYKYSGTYAPQFNSSDSLTRTFSTVGKQNIQVKYVRYTRQCETDDHFIAEWYNGSTWTTLEDLTGNSNWTVRNFVLPSSANNNSNFRIRFRTSHNGTADYGYLDDVEIYTDPM